MSVELDMIRKLGDIHRSLEQILARGAMGGAPSGGGAGSRSGSSALDERVQEQYERELRLAGDNISSYARATKSLQKETRELARLYTERLEAEAELLKAVNAEAAGSDERRAAEARRQQVLDEIGGRIQTASQRLAASYSKSSKINEELSVEYNRIKDLSIPEQILSFRNLVKGTDSLSSNVGKSQRALGVMSAALIKSANEVNSDPDSLEHARYLADLASATSILPQELQKAAGLVEEYINEAGEAIPEFKDNLSKDDFARLRSLIGVAETQFAESFAELSNAGLDVNALFEKLNSGQLSATKALEDVKARGTAELDKFTDSVLSQIVNLDALGIKIKELQIPIDETGKNFASITDIIAGAQGLKSITQVKDGVKAEIDQQRLRELAVEGLAKFHIATKKGTKGLDRLAVDVNTATGAISRNFLSLAGIAEQLAPRLGKLSTLAGVTAALVKLKDAVIDVYKQMSAFNIAHIPATFVDVNKMSVMMGMSFEETAKFLQENKKLIGLYGADAFKSLRSGMENTFERFGYTFAQAAEIIGPATEDAIARGVNIQDPKALNQFMSDTMMSFQKIAGLVNISAAEYAKLNGELFNSEDVMGNMLGMSAAQAQAYSKNLQLQRDEMAVRGISLQQAQEIIKAQEAQKRATVTQRFKSAAMNMVQMRAMGFSEEEAKRSFELEVKGRARTAEEDKEFKELRRKQGQRREGYIQEQASAGNLGAMFVAENVVDKTAAGAESEAVIRSQAGLSQAERANAGATEAQQKQAEAASKANSSMAAFGNTVNTIKSIFENSIVKAGMAAGLTLFGLSGAATKAALALNMIGGGKAGILGGISDMLGSGKGILGKAGGAVKGIATSIGPSKLIAGGLGLAAGITGTVMSSGDEGNPSEGVPPKEESTLGKVASTALTGASLGALAGPIGAAVGGVLGAGLGYLMTDKKPDEQEPPATPRAEPKVEEKKEPATSWWSSIFGKDDPATPTLSPNASPQGTITAMMASPAPVVSKTIELPGNIAPAQAVNTDETTDSKQGVLQVSDSLAQGELANANAMLVEAVRLLSEIASKNSNSSVGQIPIDRPSSLLTRTSMISPATSFSYMTGRAA